MQVTLLEGIQEREGVKGIYITWLKRSQRSHDETAMVP